MLAASADKGGGSMGLAIVRHAAAGLLPVVLAWAWASCAIAADLMATGAHLSGDSARTTLSLDLTAPVTYKVFALDNPYRVVVDLPAVEFRLPRSAGSEPVGVVTTFRYGLTGPGKSRVVIEVTGPVLVESVGIVSKEGEGTQVLKLVLASTDVATFKAHLPHRTAKTKPKPAQDASASADTEGVPQPQLASPRRALPLVVLDPGHGGPDSGALSPSGVQEKDIVLAIGKRVRDKLLAASRFKVIMTRDTDVFITLSGRVDVAEKLDADLLVSIHADSTAVSKRWQPIGGATVYTRSETASDEEARLAALKENMSDQLAGEALPADEGNTVSSIGLDLARTETRALDLVLAEQTVQRLAKAAPMTLEPHRSARFYVLKSPKVPAMLIETGYLNNHQDLPHLISPEWQDKLADAIVASIEAYFTERGKGLPTLLGLGVPQPVQ